jgi:nucleoside-diphosphate-sugar epimerase
VTDSAADRTPVPALPCGAADVDLFLSEPTPGVAESLSRIPGPFLVLGAGGKMGLHLCLMLRRGLAAIGRADPVIAVSRFSTLRDREEFESHGIQVRAADLADTAALATLPDVPTVFYLAGAKFGTAANAELLRVANVEVPRKVAARFRGARMVAFSTGCVYPFVSIDSGGATEETPVAPVGDYALSCLGRETEFAEGSRRHGTPVVLIRLNYSIEFRYGVLVDIAQKVHAGAPVDVTTGHVNVIWQRDAVAHIIQATELAGSPAVPINITGRETLRVRDLAWRFAELFDRRVKITGQEAPTAWLNNASQSHRLFGPPPTSVDQMTSWIAAWLAHGGDTWGKPTAFEKRDGRF